MKELSVLTPCRAVRPVYLKCNYLLTTDSTKTVKGEKIGVLTGILYLAPAWESRRWNMCAWADGCEEWCLGHSSGRMIYPAAKRARIARTRFLMLNRQGFKARLMREIALLVRRARKAGMVPAIRLDGSSDVSWETMYPDLFAMFPDVQFYDYTKNPVRMETYRRSAAWPKNYQLVYSVGASTVSHIAAEGILRYGGNVAVVFDKVDVSKTWNGFPIVDGDLSDVRFRDPPGTVVGLKAKGTARHADTPFVHRHTI